MDTGGIAPGADLNGISVEESKFLGGDVDHTHLVKGLDYALLQKVRYPVEKASPRATYMFWSPFGTSGILLHPLIC